MRVLLMGARVVQTVLVAAAWLVLAALAAEVEDLQ
jgi:UDP-N-acetylglucosamine enolpyruvyl transferase